MAKTKKSKGTSIPGSEALQALDNIVGAWKEYKVTAEVEATKRENIRAWRDVNIKAIEESSAVLKDYFKHHFAERRTVIQGFFKSLDQGIVQGDMQLVAQSMAAIVAISKESPLANAKQIMASIENPSVKMIEI